MNGKKVFDDVKISEGFPPGWHVIDRTKENTALLCRFSDGFLGFTGVCLCVRPKAISTAQWLPTARQIAHAIDGDRYGGLIRRLNQFLDDWGDEIDMDRVADLHRIIGGADE